MNIQDCCPLTFTGSHSNNYVAWQVDGMDVLAVRSATQFALDYCSKGKGPLVMEMVTYRYSGHSMSDPGTSYRTRDEVQNVRQTRDPITSFRERILSSEIVTADELKVTQAEIINNCKCFPLLNLYSFNPIQSCGKSTYISLFFNIIINYGLHWTTTADSYIQATVVCFLIGSENNI